jgi:hypothetical protein
MSAAEIVIRSVKSADPDATLFRSIRLEALKANPEAFGSSYEFEAAQPLSWFSARLVDSTVLGAFRDRQQHVRG